MWHIAPCFRLGIRVPEWEVAPRIVQFYGYMPDLRVGGFIPSLYGLYGTRCLLSPERLLNLISHSHSHSLPCYFVFTTDTPLRVRYGVSYNGPLLKCSQCLMSPYTNHVVPISVGADLHAKLDVCRGIRFQVSRLVSGTLFLLVNMAHVW